MSLSRRKFVYVASLSAVAAAATPSLFAQDEVSAAKETITDEGSDALANLQLKDFEWLIGERFSISSPKQKLGKLTLIAASLPDPVKPTRVAHAGAQFAAPAGRPLSRIPPPLSGRRRHSPPGHLHHAAGQSRQVPAVPGARRPRSSRIQSRASSIEPPNLPRSLHPLRRLRRNQARRPRAINRSAGHIQFLGSALSAASASGTSQSSTQAKRPATRPTGNGPIP